MAWVVQHYIPLAGAGTAWDPDPTLTQPGEFAVDGDAAELPLTTSVPGGRLWAKILLVDDAGDPVPSGASTYDVKIAKRTSEKISQTAGSQSTTKFAWAGGATALAVAAGSEVVQDQAEAPAIFVAVVTGGASTPASGRLAVSTWKAPQ